jgi:hypothetical protein
MLPLYDKKFAALKKLWNVSAFGLPKVFTNSNSELIVTGWFAGPHAKLPTKAPIELATAGMTFVRSFSTTSTPGES